MTNSAPENPWDQRKEEGRNAVWFAGQDPSAKVVAVDGSSVGLAKARALAAERGARIETQVGDLASWDPGEERWDAIVSIWAPTPPTVRAALHARCVRALRPGGVLILEAYPPCRRTRPRD